MSFEDQTEVVIVTYGVRVFVWHFTDVDGHMCTVLREYRHAYTHAAHTPTARSCVHIEQIQMHARKFG